MRKSELPDGVELVDPRLEGLRPHGLDVTASSLSPAHVKLPSNMRTSHGPGGVAVTGGMYVCMHLWYGLV